MSYIPIDSNIVPLLQGLKPYLGSKSQVITEGILSLIQVMTSHHGQEAVKSMSKLYSVSGLNDRMITVNTVAGPVALSVNMVFLLFLILILLLLSGNLLAVHPGIPDGTALDSGLPAPENSSNI